jgi:prepilin-type N-terminal cleavage/methylation domain-containing protein
MKLKLFFSNKKTKAFTLIELLVVIAIIGNLSVIAIINLNDARARARDAVRMQDLNVFSKALEMYFLENDLYPCGNAGYTDHNGDLATLDTTWSCPAATGEGFINGPDSTPPTNCISPQTGGLHLSGLLYTNCPKDPINQMNLGGVNYGYLYTVSNDRQSFTISTYLERNNTKMANDGGVCGKYYEIKGGKNLNDPRGDMTFVVGAGCN